MEQYKLKPAKGDIVCNLAGWFGVVYEAPRSTLQKNSYATLGYFVAGFANEGGSVYLNELERNRQGEIRVFEPSEVLGLSEYKLNYLKSQYKKYAKKDWV